MDKPEHISLFLKTQEESQQFFLALQEEKKRSYGNDNHLSDTALRLQEKMRDKKAGKQPTINMPSLFTRPRQQQLELPCVVPVVRDPAIAPLGNWIAKSSIFAPRKPGIRDDTGSNWIKLESPRGIGISYNGPHLDMSDHTLYLNLMKLAEGRLPEEFVYIKRSELLRRCGYKTLGKSGYKWLESAFDRLCQANVKLELNNYSIKQQDSNSFQHYNQEIREIDGEKITRAIVVVKLISTFAHTPENGDFYFSLPPSSLALFANKLYGYNDLKKRLLLSSGKRADLAAWLQSYICADSTGEHDPIYIETLQRFSASNVKISDFARRLAIALENCQQADIIKSWKIFTHDNGKKMVLWVR